jgi:putative protease
MLRAGLAFGADAIYAGQPRYSLRVRNNGFGRVETLAAALAEARALGKSFYLVGNVVAHNAKTRTFLADMKPIVALGPDALIMADPGLISLVRETWPEMPVHLSVQANTVNFAAARFWQKLGIRRIILSRELSLDEIAEIREECPDIELEVFVHGALCIAYSGRCLLSGYFNRRDSNQGACTNACRWNYAVRPGGEDASGGVWLLEEKTRPGEPMPVEEDRHGTYILNSKDLRALEHVQKLVEIGVDALKIEGRTKSPYYAARTAQVYRRAIDASLAGEVLDPALFSGLEGLANRGYTDGFLRHRRGSEMQNFLRGHSESERSRYVGDVIARDTERGLFEIDVKNRFSVGDRLEIVHPSGNFEITLNRMENSDGASIDIAPGNGHRVWIPLPDGGEYSGAFVARFLRNE